MAAIPYLDVKAERADFHDLRTTFGRLLVITGVSELVRNEIDAPQRYEADRDKRTQTEAGSRRGMQSPSRRF